MTDQALQLFKSNISVYCEDEEITDDNKQKNKQTNTHTKKKKKKLLKIMRGKEDEGNKRPKVTGLSEEDKRRSDKLW